jgi:oligopeptide transport system substrate-binding protein
LSKLPELKFQYADTAGNRLIVQFLQGQIQDNLGITITLEPMEPKAFSQLVNAEQHTWAWFGWGADYPDPENFLVPNFKTGAGNNHTGYSSAEFDALCDEASFELDDATRMGLWAEAAQIESEDAPVICMFYRERFWLAKPTVKDLTTTGMDGQVTGDMFFYKTYLSE